MTDDFSRRIASIASGFSDDDVFIIGKAPSIDQVDVDGIAGGLIINLNDSEAIAQGQVCLFHHRWVVESLDRLGFGGQHYFTDQTDDLPPSMPTPHTLEFVPFTPERADLLLFRFLEPRLYLEEILFVSAIRLARFVAAERKRSLNVFLLGFDFAVTGGSHSRHIDFDYSRDSEGYRDSLIRRQEQHLIDVLHLLDETGATDIKLTHVGTRSYSRLNVDQFNYARRQRKHAVQRRRGSTSVPPPRQTTDDRDRVLVVAELTTNHFGDIDRLVTMVRLAAKAGADLVKVQKRDVEGFYSAEQLASPYRSPFGTTFGDYRRQLELTDEAFAALDAECRAHGIDWFASVLDLASFRALHRYRKRLLKLPSTISEHRDLHAAVASAHRGEIVVSTGYTDASFEAHVIDTFSGNERLYLLQTNSAYPTPPQDCSVSVIRHYRDLGHKSPNVVPGYSSHDLGSLGSLLAVAAGARMLEKHVKLGDTEWAHFDSVALDLATTAFTDYVKDVRLAEVMCGDETKRVNPSEHHKYFLRPDRQ